MKNIALYIVTLLLYSFDTCSQSISNSYTNPGYGSLAGDISLTYSIGDIFYGELDNEQLIISGMFMAKSDNPLSIPPAPGENEVLIYPNPCRSTVFLRTTLTEDLYFSLYSLNGVLLKHTPLRSDQGVDVVHLPNGLYIIKITDADHTLYCIDKLIKTN